MYRSIISSLWFKILIFACISSTSEDPITLRKGGKLHDKIWFWSVVQEHHRHFSKQFLITNWNKPNMIFGWKIPPLRACQGFQCYELCFCAMCLVMKSPCAFVSVWVLSLVCFGLLLSCVHLFCVTPWLGCLCIACCLFVSLRSLFVHYCCLSLVFMCYFYFFVQPDFHFDHHLFPLVLKMDYNRTTFLAMATGYDYWIYIWQDSHNVTQCKNKK